MNGFEVQNQWIKYAEEQRKRMAADMLAKVRESADRMNAACDWVLQALPLLVENGEPEPHAVLAAAEVKRRADGAPVTKSAVLDWLDAHAVLLRARGYYDDDWLAQRQAAIEGSR